MNTTFPSQYIVFEVLKQLIEMILSIFYVTDLQRWSYSEYHWVRYKRWIVVAVGTIQCRILQWSDGVLSGSDSGKFVNSF